MADEVGGHALGGDAMLFRHALEELKVLRVTPDFEVGRVDVGMFFLEACKVVVELAAVRAGRPYEDC
ncbi:MAG: hypothetical protein HC945_02085, partial [Nitrosarchaeum sp.]|nr:hypothetical protein [Nitrosarchaeum sp.]